MIAKLDGFQTTISYKGRQAFCFGCHKKGHYKRECPNHKEPTCWHCDEVVHVKAECPKLKAEDNTHTLDELPPLENNDGPDASRDARKANQIFLGGVLPEHDPERPLARKTNNIIAPHVLKVLLQ